MYVLFKSWSQNVQGDYFCLLNSMFLSFVIAMDEKEYTVPNE